MFFGVKGWSINRNFHLLKFPTKRGDDYIAHKVLKRRLPPEAKLGKQASSKGVVRRVMAGSVSSGTILQALESNCMKNSACKDRQEKEAGALSLSLFLFYLRKKIWSKIGVGKLVPIPHRTFVRSFVVGGCKDRVSHHRCRSHFGWRQLYDFNRFS